MNLTPQNFGLDRTSCVAQDVGMGSMDEANDDAICLCGHKLFLHDDGKDKCAECDSCERFEAGR